MSRRAADLLRRRLALAAVVRYGGGPVLTGLCLVYALRVLLPAVEALVAGSLVAAVAGGGAAATELTQVGWPLLGIAGVLLVRQFASALYEPLQLAAERAIDGRLRQRMLAVVGAEPRIAWLEQAEVQDEVLRATGRSNDLAMMPGAGAVGQLWLAFRYLGAAATALVLARVSWWLAVAVFLLMVVQRAVMRRHWVYLVRAEERAAPQQRRAEYWAELAATPGAAKELRTFGLADWVLGRQDRYAGQVISAMWEARRRVLGRQWWVFVIAAGCAVLAYTWPMAAAIRGEIGAGELATCLFATAGVFGLGWVGFEVYFIEQSRASLAALDRLADRVAPTAAGAPAPRQRGAAGGADPGAPAVAFDRVSFRYPTGHRPVLDGLSLTIRPMERLGVVGANGVGKTTLVKLLAGLYSPDEGHISIGGVDVAGSGPPARHGLTVVFQDFIRYELSARDNIALAAPQHVPDAALLSGAARDAGVLDLIEQLPQGWDTPLSRAYTGGTDLSGGQWQRFAIARALYAVRCGARIVVMDEPTANLDVTAELEFVRTVLATIGEATVVLISHRLSTIRQVDRIVLLDGGAVAESGSHDELMRLDGAYAAMFRMQAARFRPGVVAGDKAESRT